MTTGPTAFPNGGHCPAGWVSPESHDHAQRQAIKWQLAQEDEQAARAAREQAIAERIASIRGVPDKPADEPARPPRVVAIVGEEVAQERSLADSGRT